MQFNSEPEVGGGGNFLRLKDKESVVGVFRGNVYEFRVIWKEKRTVLTSDNDPQGKFRFRINFVTKENGALASKIWEQGAGVYNQLKALNSEYELETMFVKITRNGTGMDTEYSILPLLKNEYKWTDDIEAKVSVISLHDLEHKNGSVNSNDPDEKLPF